MEDDFFEKNSSKLFWITILIAVVIRLYFFILTRNQALWWDEAEYMLISKIWAGLIPDVGWFGGRPLLLPFIGFLFYKLKLNGEFAVRTIEFLLSILGVLLIYFIGKMFYNKKIGIIAAFIGSFFYLDFFYSNRIMVDIPSSVLGFLGFYLILKSLIHNKNNFYLIIGSISLIAATLLKYTGVLFILATIISLFLLKGFSLLKEKKILMAGITGILAIVPFIIYILSNRRILAGIFEAGTSAASLPLSQKFGVFFSYITYMPTYLQWVFFITFILGLFTMIDVFLGFDLILKRQNLRLLHDFIILILMLIPLIYFGFFVNHFEERYLIYSFLPIFIITAKGLVKLEDYIKPYTKYAFIIIIALLLVGSYQQFKMADSLTKSKMNAFQPQRLAGDWLKENTREGDIIFASEDPQFTYYAEVDVLGFPATIEEFHQQVKKTNAKYMVVSIYEKPPNWIYSYAQDYPNNVEAKAGFNLDGKPAIIIYEIKKENIG